MLTISEIILGIALFLTVIYIEVKFLYSRTKVAK